MADYWRASDAALDLRNGLVALSDVQERIDEQYVAHPGLIDDRDRIVTRIRDAVRYLVSEEAD